MVLLGTDVPDELSEVAEECCGTSLISSTIISLGVRRLHELRGKIVLFSLSFPLLYMLHLKNILPTALEVSNIQ